MTLPTKLLVPLEFPLRGEKLIEASAGTGKTYTIMTLYLRLLLHHGLQQKTKTDTDIKTQNRPTAFHCPLSVKQILVVTFTEAATAELRGRIRNRIAQAKQAFISGSSEDAEICQLLEDIDPALYRQHAVQLEANEHLLDEASIFTIHGFCQRMLKQNAFESGAYFNIELVQNREVIQLQAVKDFWRKQINSLAGELFSRVVEIWKSPENLLKSLHVSLDRKDIEIRANYSPQGLEQLHSEYISLLQQFKADWLSAVKSSDMLLLLQKTPFKKSSVAGKRGIPILFAAVNRWAENDADIKPPEELQYFSQTKLHSAKLASAAEPQHVLFIRCDALLSNPLINDYEKFIKDTIYLEALDFVRQSVQSHKLNHQELSFDDLLNDLDDALQGERGMLFSQRIREQFPVAMIDEFQDTDAVQYRIFSQVYKDQPGTGWYLIGDPKQAIYGFRGADIFTYIHAKRSISEHYSLTTNWRSSSNMISAVNQIFNFSLHNSSAKDLTARQSEFEPFIYGQDIPFYEVTAPSAENGQICRADNTPMLIDGNRPEALALLLNTTAQGYISKDDYEKNMALITAQKICNLIQKGAQGTASIGQRAVVSSDIAVLVRDGEQAKLIKKELLLKGINSVYLSERSNVFSTQEAMSLTYLMKACLEPEKKSRLKTAIAVPFLDLTFEQLDAYEEDDNLLDQLSVQFRAYQNQWQEQGILAMIRNLIFDYALTDKYLAEHSITGDGERCLTDLLHLSELLQEASTRLDSQPALLQWLEEQINSNSCNTEERQLRLENDQKLVQIVTIHKAKGLEYNIVFMPFICKYRDHNDPVARYHEQYITDQCRSNDQELRQIIDLTGSSESRQNHQKESLAEEIRLLYVGLTRSIYQCYLGIAPFRSGTAKKCMLHKSAIGYLLNSAKPMTQDVLIDKLERLSQHQAIAIDCFSRQNVFSTQPLNDCTTQQLKAHKTLKALVFDQQLETNWWVSSFTSLSRFHEQPDASEERIDDAIELEIPDSLQLDSIHTFPRGAQHGTFMHLLFEALDFTDKSTLESLVIKLAEKYGYEDKWNSILTQMVRDCIDSPVQLDDEPGSTNTLYLHEISNQQKLVEMEFYLPMKKINAESINRIISTYDELSSQAGELNFNLVQGMLKGFIDLFFEYSGKYYILDYKSNYLGSSTEHYNRTAMRKAMLEHRYDLQYQFYTLAVHRYLKSRLKDYNYKQHFGGVIYLFLRGVNNDDSNNNQYGVYFTRPDHALINKLDHLFKQGAV